jgi:hypothetical protein
MDVAPAFLTKAEALVESFAPQRKDSESRSFREAMI